MTARTRLDRARRLLLGVLALHAIGWGLVATLLGLFVVLGLDQVLSLSHQVRMLLLEAAAGGGLVLAAWLGWRNRGLARPVSVALWLEGKIPELRFALVTLAEGRGEGSPALEDEVRRQSWRRPLMRALQTGAGLPVAVAVTLLVAFLMLPAGARGRVTAPAPGDLLLEPSAPVDPLRNVVVRIHPPGYSGLASQTLENPASITGLAGSRIEVLGRGAPDQMQVSLRGAPIAVRPEAPGWLVRFQMPDSSGPLWLRHGDDERLVGVEPRPDSVPTVHLLRPAGDSVLRSQSGSLELLAILHDDFGLGSAWFEYIVSSGEGENFTFRSGELGRREFRDVSGDTLRWRLDLDSLGLKPGNVIHLRSVARDRNTVTGPGVGYSETRTLRIPHEGEGDSVAVGTAAPAVGDSSLLSQRMLLLMTEALERRRPRLGRDTLLAESRAIGHDQDALRRRVADIIFMRLGAESSNEESEDTSAAGLTPDQMLEAASAATVSYGGEAIDFSEDESPVVALNRPLLEAYNAMWEASRALAIGEPGRAIPPMRRALAAIERARQAERLYLRGRPAAVVVDLERVRLAGKRDEADPASLEPGPGITERERLVTRFRQALAALPGLAGVDSLALLRLEALDRFPRFSRALGEALEHLREGEDASDALIQARRALEGQARVVPGLLPWEPAR